MSEKRGGAVTKMSKRGLERQVFVCMWRLPTIHINKKLVCNQSIPMGYCEVFITQN